jgi:hypothetical protein
VATALIILEQAFDVAMGSMTFQALWNILVERMTPSA